MSVTGTTTLSSGEKLLPNSRTGEIEITFIMLQKNIQFFHYMISTSEQWDMKKSVQNSNNEKNISEVAKLNGWRTE